MVKRDISQIVQVAREFGMSDSRRRGFGKYVETCKLHGERGSGQDGDFTYGELQEKAREYLGLN